MPLYTDAAVSMKAALWTVALPLVLFKVWGLALLLMFSPTGDALALIGATHWPWLVIPALLMAGPLYAWYRLVRARARRRELQLAEWMGRPPGPKDRLAVQGQWPLWETVSRVERGGS